MSIFRRENVIYNQSSGNLMIELKGTTKGDGEISLLEWQDKVVQCIMQFKASELLKAVIIPMG